MRQGNPEDWSAGTSSIETGHPQGPLPDAHAALNSNLPESTANAPPQRQAIPISLKLKRWSKNWFFWAALGATVSGGMGFVAVALLLRLPSLPNCPAIFWPMASASVRLYCAQVAASKQTVNDLLEAIALVQALPRSHPLRPEINRQLQEWSLNILDLADEAFQAGQLEAAISTARKIPPDVPAYQLVEERINSWQSTWSQAEDIYRQAEAEMRQQHWHQAYMAAVRLLNVGNDYWATTKYQELNSLIETAKLDAGKLAKAQNLAKAGSLDNLLAAIKLLESINSESYIYQDAQDALPDLGRQILDLAQQALDRRDADAAIAIANQIPASTSLQMEAQDFVALANAWRNAWIGTVQSLQDAIIQAQNISSDRPLYDKAQELVSRWQLEIEDVTHLERASQLAQGGSIKDLNAAIAEAKLIPATNPLASQAAEQINRWRSQVETIEDRPYLNHALELASLGDINSLQAAITEASQIASGRALYQEAQSKIWDWTAQIQRIQDQPYLDRAEQLASAGDVTSLEAAVSEASQIAPRRALSRRAQSKIQSWTAQIQRIQDQPLLDEARALAAVDNLPAAIAAAQRIQPGRALSRQAQNAVNDWQGQILARQNWQQARQVALQGTPDALVQAIRLADRVPASSSLRADANAAISGWSQQMLSIAQSRAESDIPGGIAIARLVPPGTNAYRAAQLQIAAWQKFLNPTPAPQQSLPAEDSNN